MLELKSCPHCNGNGRIVSVSGFKSDRYRAVCEECGASTRECETEQEAVSAWNMRADGWIPVGERLPENDYGKHWKDRKQYLVMMSNGMYTVCRFGYKEYDWWIDRNDSVIGRFNQVVKWMELEPPKGEQE